MITELNTAPFTEEAVRRLSGALGEPTWALEQRLAALEVFHQLDWPRESEEFWKRTDAMQFDLAGYDDGTGSGHGSVCSAGFANFAAAAPAGVIAMGLDDAVREHPDLVRLHLGTQIPLDRDRFAALHYAFRRGGIFVHVPAGVTVEVPLAATTRVDSVGVTAFPHTLLVVERGGSATLIDDRSGEGAGQLIVDVVEVVVGEGARAGHNAVNEQSDQAIVRSFQRFAVARDGLMESVNVVVGGASHVAHTEASLVGRGATARMAGVLFGRGEQRFDQQTLQEHAAEHTTSDLLYKTVLAESARSMYAGLIRVHPGAQKTDAYQANRNLLLSPRAKADSVPKLQIEANDVRCTHGATVGPVDREQLFYLMARGLNRLEAERLVVDGFFQPVLDRIPLESVRTRIGEALGRRLALELD